MISKSSKLTDLKGLEDPFEECQLNRSQNAVILKDIVSAAEEGLVIALNNKWGTGKTFFIERWQELMRREGFQTLYFNAWENDFQKDVLVALLAELDILRDTNAEANFKNVLSKATPFLKKSGIALLKGLAKKVAADELLQSILDGTIEATVEGLENEIKSYTAKKKGIEDFKKSLGAFAELLGNGKHIVFIIDELDRCRPSYAVEVLEQIKHLFSVPGIIFVLSIDKEQLGHAVRGVYGSEQLDADEYLRRFIDLEYSLPEPDVRSYCAYIYDEFKFDEFFLSEERKKYSVFKYDKSNFLEFSIILFDKNNLTLRQIEKQFILARIGLRSFGQDTHVLPRIFILLIYIKQFKLDLFYSIRDKKILPQEFLKNIEFIFANKIEDFNIRDQFLYFEVVIVNLYLNYFNDQIEHPDEIINLWNPDGEINLLSVIDQSENNVDFKRIANGFKQDHNLKRIKIDHILKKVELIDPIVKV